MVAGYLKFSYHLAPVIVIAPVRKSCDINGPQSTKISHSTFKGTRIACKPTIHLQCVCRPLKLDIFPRIGESEVCNPITSGTTTHLVSLSLELTVLVTSQATVIAPRA